MPSIRCPCGDRGKRAWRFGWPTSSAFPQGWNRLQALREDGLVFTQQQLTSVAPVLVTQRLASETAPSTRIRGVRSGMGPRWRGGICDRPTGFQGFAEGVLDGRKQRTRRG